MSDQLMAMRAVRRGRSNQGAPKQVLASVPVPNAADGGAKKRGRQRKVLNNDASILEPSLQKQNDDEDVDEPTTDGPAAEKPAVDEPATGEPAEAAPGPSKKPKGVKRLPGLVSLRKKNPKPSPAKKRAKLEPENVKPSTPRRAKPSPKMKPSAPAAKPSPKIKPSTPAAKPSKKEEAGDKADESAAV